MIGYLALLFPAVRDCLLLIHLLSPVDVAMHVPAELEETRRFDVGGKQDLRYIQSFFGRRHGESPR